MHLILLPSVTWVNTDCDRRPYPSRELHRSLVSWALAQKGESLGSEWLHAENILKVPVPAPLVCFASIRFQANNILLQLL